MLEPLDPAANLTQHQDAQESVHSLSAGNGFPCPNVLIAVFLTQLRDNVCIEQIGHPLEVHVAWEVTLTLQELLRDFRHRA